MRTIILNSPDGIAYRHSGAGTLSHIVGIALRRSEPGDGEPAHQGGLFALCDGEPVRLLLQPEAPAEPAKGRGKAPPRPPAHQVWRDCGLEHALGTLIFEGPDGLQMPTVSVANIGEAFLRDYLAMEDPQGLDRVIAAYAMTVWGSGA